MQESGNTKQGVSLYQWPPVRVVWNQLYDNWKFLFLFALQTNPNQSNRRSMVQWYFPLLYSLQEYNIYSASALHVLAVLALSQSVITSISGAPSLKYLGIVVQCLNTVGKSYHSMKTVYHHRTESYHCTTVLALLTVTSHFKKVLHECLMTAGEYPSTAGCTLTL